MSWFASFELNIRYLYLKHEKEIDKLLSLDKNETLKELEISLIASDITNINYKRKRIVE